MRDLDTREQEVERRRVLDQLLLAGRRRARAEADRFLLLADLAELYAAVDDSSPVLVGERLVQLGGEGTPRVAEFIGFELGPRLGMRPETAAVHLGHSLAVKFRLPEIWHLVDDLAVPVWCAENLAMVTRDLGLGPCLWLSAELAERVHQMGPQRLLDYAQARVLELQPGPECDARQRALATRSVRVQTGEHTAQLDATLDVADALFLNAQVNRLADVLAQGGDPDDLEVRRAKALGLLASPARALQLVQASLVDELPDDLDTSCPARGQRGHTCGAVTVDPDRLLPVSQVVVHLTDTTASTGQGMVRVEGLRPKLAQWLSDLLGHTRVTVLPLLDTSAIQPSSAYQVPARMREAVIQRNPTSVFPCSTRPARRLDQDHTVPFDPHGPPGQTHLGNLGPLGRKEHRAKTHGGWTVRQPLPGYFLWRSPLGYHYLVTPSGTWSLDPPPPEQFELDEGLPPSHRAA